jgi:hypothetical protein
VRDGATLAGGRRYTVDRSRIFSTNGSFHVKKGRHRRFEEARALKRLTEENVEPCAECGAEPGADHAAWCLAMEDEEEEEYSDPEPHRA